MGEEDWSELMCCRSALTNEEQIGGAYSCQRFICFWSRLGVSGGLPRLTRIWSRGETEEKRGRSRRRETLLNSGTHSSRTCFVAGHESMQCVSSPRTCWGWQWGHQRWE